MYSFNKKHLFILTACWLIVNLFVYMTLGVKYAIDTVRFNHEASKWLSGTVEFSYHFWYTGYIALLFFCKAIFHSIYASVFIQCAISLVSILLFYMGISRIVKNEWVGFIAALLIILYLPIQQWNLCLLTESLYISTILLFIWVYSFENYKSKWIGLASIAVLAALLRPNGGILLVTFFILSAKHCITKQNQQYVYALSVLVMVGFIFLLNNTTTVFYQFLLDSFNKGEVICGYSGWTVPIKSPVENNVADGSIIKIVYLLRTHPVECTKLAMYRLVALYTDVRLYYSNLHNTFIALFLFPVYLSAGIGIFHYRKKYTGLFLITIAYAGLNSLLIMITYADWDGRFLAPLLPVVFIWSALGLQHIYSYRSITYLDN